MDGLIIRHPQTGVVIFNPDTVTAHIRAAFTTTGSSGSLSIPDLARGGGFVVQALPANQGTDFGTSVFTITGTTLSWTAASRPMRVVVATRANTSSGGAKTFDGYSARRLNGSVVQISNVDRTLQLSNYGALTLTATGSVTSLPMVYGTLTVAGTNPVLAWKATNGMAVSIHRVAVGSGQFTFYFACQNNGEVGIQWWTFDVSAQGIKLDTDVALVLRDPSDGTTAFDSRAYALNIIDGGSTGRLVPSAGQELAAIQATFGHRHVAYETDVVPGDTPPGPGWKYLTSESYHSAAVFFSDGSAEYGLYRYEFWTGWDTAAVQDSYMGATAHAFANIAGLPRAPMPNVNTITVNVSPSSGGVTLTAAGPTTTVSSSVTATATGGSGQGYTYTWHPYAGGDSGVVANTDASGPVFSTKVVNQQPGTVRVGKWWCRVQDSAGRVGWSEPITFTHTLNSADLTPDSITLPTMNVSSNDPDVSWDTLSYGTYTVTGINAPITVRFERYDYSGNLSALHIDVYTKAPGGSWVHHGYYNAHESGAKYMDIPNVVNGTEVRYRPHAITNSGRRSGSCRFVLWALETNVQFGSSASCSFMVDADDNYNNADYIPDTIDWGNISGSTEAVSFFSSNAARTISGINRTINIRGTISGFSGSNIVSGSRLDVWVNGVKRADSTNIANGSWTAADVNNNDTVYFVAHLGANNQSLAASASYTVTVTNITTGQVLDTFTVNQTANSIDQTPDSISVPTLELYTNEPSGWTNDGQFQITGINRSIVLRFTRGNQWDSGGIFTRRLFIYHSTNGGASWTEYFIGAGAQAVADITVNNGDWIVLRAYCDTTSGIGQTSFTGYVTNYTTGAQLASFLVTATVDADNNYNVADPYPNPISWSNHNINTTANYGESKQPPTSIQGINQQITLKWTISGHSQSGGTSHLDVYRNYGFVYRTTTGNGHWASATFNNGDVLELVHSLSSPGGRVTASYTVTVTNESAGGQVIGSYTVTAGVGVTQNLVVTLSSNTASGHGGGSPGEWTTAEAAGQIAVSISGAIGTPQLTWEKVSGSGPGTWGVSGTYNPTFSYFGQANFNESAIYKLKVTDSQRTVYSEDVYVYMSGGIQN